MASVSSTKKVANKGLIKTIEVKVGCNYQVEDGRLVDKVLDGNATCSIETTEKVGDFLQFAGKVNLTSVFVDSEKQLGSEKVETTFSEKVQVGDISAFVVIPVVVSVKQRRETSTYVDCTITLRLEVYGVMQDSIAYVEAGDPRFVESLREVECESLLCFNNSSFTHTEEVEASEIVDRIIAHYMHYSINRVVPNGNYVAIEGEIVRDVVYLVGESVKKLQKRSDFNQEIALLNCTDETILSTQIYGSGESLSLSINSDETKSIFAFNTNFNVSVWGFEKSKFNVLEDIYSTSKEVQINRLAFTSVSHCPSVIVNDTLNETIDMSDKKRIDEIVSIGSNIVVADGVKVCDGELTIDGVIHQKVIAKNYDNDDIFMAEVEVPFNTRVNLGIDSDCSLSLPIINAWCTSSKNKAGKELNLSYKISVMSDITQTKVEDYISDCVELEEKPRDLNSIVIYMPEKNERIFEIAKKLNVAPELVLAQNPGISDNEPIQKVTLFKCMK